MTGLPQSLSTPVPATRRTSAEGPDFFCVGLQKGGTQWLYDQLQHHPDFWMPPYKELHYFDRAFPDAKISRAAKRFLERPRRSAVKRERRGDRDVDERDGDFYRQVSTMVGDKRDLSLYASLFAHKGDLLTGDITPGYSTLGDRPIAALAERFSDAKVVMMLREPASRLWSQWLMDQREDGVPSGHELDFAKFKAFAGRKAVMKRSFPTEIAKRWSARFGDRFRWFFLDDVAARPEETRAAILAFLGADPTIPSTLNADFNRKAKTRTPQRTPEIQALMRSLFETERRAGAKMFGGPALDWPDAPW